MSVGLEIKMVSSVMTVAKSILEIVTPRIQESMKEFSDRLLFLAEKDPSLEEYFQMIDKATDILGDILYAVGINSDSADELGMKIANSEKTLNEFKSIEEYILHLKNDVELDREKFEDLLTEERMVYATIGLAVEAGAIGEKVGIQIPVEIVELLLRIYSVGKLVLDAKEIVEIIIGVKNEGISNLNDIVDCVLGSGESDRMKTGDILVKVLNTIYSNQGESILSEIQEEMRG